MRRKKKFHVFGKSSWDSPAIVSSCLDVNVSTNSVPDELSVCKNQCYKRLILKRSNRGQKGFLRVTDVLKRSACSTKPKIEKTCGERSVA